MSSVVAGAAILAVTGLLRAPGVAQAQERPTFRSEVELVTVDVVVVDGKGRPVTGLGKDAFVVEEDGQPQPIASFEATSVPDAAEASPSPAEPPLVATNAPAARRTGRVFALVVDDLRLPAEQSRYLRRALNRFIDESLSPGDTVIVDTASGDEWWRAGIPEGREDLHHVVDRIAGRYAGATTELTNAYQDHAMPAGPRPASSTSTDIDWPIVVAMERALDALAPGTGRASLVFFAAGFANDDTAREVRAAAARSRAAFYFVDVRGLQTGLTSAADRKEPADNENPGTLLQQQLKKLNLDASSAEALAEEMGGFSVRNNNDLAAGGEAIAAESRAFYRLGIAPRAGKGRDTWRKLRVTVRRAGLTVRARRGYSVAAAGTDTNAPAPIPLRLASYVLEPTDPVTRIVAVAEIDTTGLAADLQMRLEATPRDGGKTQIQDLSLQAAANDGWRPARVELALPAGVYELRVFLRDPSTGRTGTVEQRVGVPDPAAFRLSTPVLSDTVAALPIAHDELKSTAERPLLVSFEVFGATPEAATGNRRVATAFDLKDGQGRSLAAAPATLLSPAPDGRWQQTIALPALPNGAYDLAITAQDRVAGTERIEHRAFEIVGGAEPERPPTGELAALLARAGRYASSYANDFSNVVAEEECRQIVHNELATKRAVRLLKSGVFFISVPGAFPWTTFRDVWEVDGVQVHDHEQRVARIFQDSSADALTRARAILDESNRYNLGPRRTVNAPTLALLFLLPQNQRRFEFELKGRERLQGAMATIVAFHERVSPALVAGTGPGGSPAAGRMWIDPERGVVVKTDVTYDADRVAYEHDMRARIVTEYRPEPRLGLWVPAEMTESYSWPRDTPAEAATRYSDYRRFGVSTEESYGAPRDAPPADQ